MRSTILLSLFTVLPALRAAEPGLPRATPESQGVSSEAIRAFVEAADKDVATMHSFMLVRHGKIVAECWWKPETADKPHVMHSLSKSFTSTAVGLVVEEGRLSVDDPVLKFFPDLAPVEPSENLKAMKVCDLLSMSCGHDTAPKQKDDEAWVKTFLAHPVPHKPGTHFVYNSLGTYMLSAIVTKLTGKTLLEYLAPKLFEPLGIKDPEWGASPQGNTFGGWGLKVRTEDIAKFGQLYLQKGMWNGKQLVPAKWVEEATTKKVENKKATDDEATIAKSDWKQGYCYQFWRCRHDAYRGDGANGQFCIVLPEQDAVIAITADTGNMQKEIDVVWDKLLPAFKDKPLPEDKEGLAKLKQVMAELKAKEKPPAKPKSAPEEENEIVIGPTYKDAPELTMKPGVPRGAVKQFTMNSEDSKLYPGIAKKQPGVVPYKRKVSVYVPKQSVAGAALPFIVVQDGGGYVKNVTAALDTLIHEKRVPVMAAVFIDSGGGDAQGSQRGLEYDTVSEVYAGFVETEVLPRAAKEADVKFTADPEGRATMGGSSGGSAAFTMAWFRPDLYHRVLTYSGTYVNQQSPLNPKSPHGAWEYHENLIPKSEAKPLRVWLEVSENDNGSKRDEASLHNWVLANQRMAAALKAKGYQYRYVFAKEAGHTDGKVTRQTLPEALEWLWKGYATK